MIIWWNFFKQNQLLEICKLHLLFTKKVTFIINSLNLQSEMRTQLILILKTKLSIKCENNGHINWKLPLLEQETGFTKIWGLKQISWISVHYHSNFNIVFIAQFKFHLDKTAFPSLSIPNEHFPLGDPII